MTEEHDAQHNALDDDNESTTNDERYIRWLLHLVTRDLPDQHGQPSCFSCYPSAWHYTIQGTTFDPSTTRCTCPCHEIRARLGQPDELANPC